jgi:hypothetical protein
VHFGPSCGQGKCVRVSSLYLVHVVCAAGSSGKGWPPVAWQRGCALLAPGICLLRQVCVCSTYSDTIFGCSVVRRLRTGRPGFDPRQRQRILPLTSASRPALRPTQPPVQWVPGALSPGLKRGRGVMLTTHPLPVPWLRKSRSYTSCHPNAPLWSVTGPLYLSPLFADHIRALTESFDSKSADAGNPLVRQLGRHLCRPRADRSPPEVTESTDA